MTTLSLLVLRTSQLEKTLRFYQAVGLNFVEEKHGTGPLHYACEFNGMVIEIFPAEREQVVDRKSGGATMLGFRVRALEQTLSLLAEQAIHPLSAPKESAWGRRTVVLDPDGRAVELSEGTS